MSEQHVFPDRLKHVLPRVHGTREYGSWNETRRNRKTVQSAQKVKRNQGSMGTSRVRKVCQTCNQGWLNTMEQDCFPLVEQLIRGELVALRTDEQVKVARIAISIAMTGEALARRDPITTQAERELFRQTLAPPPGWYVFLGRMANASTEPALFKEGCIRSGKNVAPNEKVFATFTMVMGGVILHVLSLAPGNFLDPDHYAHILGLSPLCPPTDWVNFAFMPALDAAQVASIISYAKHSFREFIEG